MDNQENNSFVTEDLPEEVEIIGISFRGSGKVYYFGANGCTAREGEHAIVETARGMEYGRVTLANTFVKRETLVLPLKNVIRLADKNDDLRFEANREKEQEAFAICQNKILDHKLDMKLIDVEYTFDNSKLLFYFTSDDRVDFRELVKDLAGFFRTRIELRQIGIRDEAKIMGGLGICGRPFCCSSFLPDFVQVSIKMAKEQNLSLNSAKISGACGRLMCCLRYEYDTYQEELRRMPKLEAPVVTPDGPGVVVEVKPLVGQVRVRLQNENEKQPKTYSLEQLRPADKRGDAPAPTAAAEEASSGTDKPQGSAKEGRGEPRREERSAGRDETGSSTKDAREDTAQGRNKNRRGRGGASKDVREGDREGSENARSSGERNNHGRGGRGKGRGGRDRNAENRAENRSSRESRESRETQNSRESQNSRNDRENREPRENAGGRKGQHNHPVNGRPAGEKADANPQPKENGRASYAPLPSNSVKRGSRNRMNTAIHTRPSGLADKEKKDNSEKS